MRVCYGHREPFTLLGRVNTTKPFDDQSEIDEVDKHQIEFLEAREDASTSLQSPEQSLDLVASLVHRAIIFPGIDSIALGRNHGNEVEVQRQLASFLALLRTIHEKVGSATLLGPTHAAACAPSGASRASPGDGAKVMAVRASAATI